MRKLIYLLCVLLLSYPLLSQPTPPSGKQWQAVPELTDEFNSFNSAKWQKGHPYWSGRSPSKFNNNNLSWSGGNFQIKGTLKNANRTGDFIWTGCLTSKQKSFKPGMYAEVRMKHADMAIVSSFWMQGNFSEIDVVENWGEVINSNWNYLEHTMEMNTHYFINGWNNDQKTPKHSANPNNAKNSGEYWKWGVWWKDSRNIIWYRNGVQVASVTLPYDFNEDMYMFFDMEAFTWGPGVASNSDLNNNTKNTAYYDWVHTYKLVDGTPPANETVSCASLPSSVSSATSYTVQVPYTANTSRDVVVELWNSNWLTEGKTTVNAGSGTANVTLNLSSAPAVGSNYLWKASIRPVGAGWQQNIDACNKNNVSVTSGGPSQSPFGGSARSVPGTIEAEDFDVGGQGIAYNDADASNNGPNVMRENEGVDIESRDGGNNVGWTANGEWLEYTVDATSGSYDLEARIATTTTGKSLVAKLDGTTLGTFNLPNTGGWGTFQTVKIQNVSVTGGNGKILRLEFVGGGVNLNWVKFSTGGGGNPVTTTLEPINDAYLQGSTNFNNTLVRTESGNRVGYLMFDLSGVSGTITAAQLKMTCNGDAGNGAINVDLGSSNNWTESNLSNSNKPSSSAQLGSLNSTYSIGNTYTWNLTPSSLSGGGNVSLIVTQTSGNDVAFASKENSATSPQLVVTYVPSGARSTLGSLPTDEGIMDESEINVYPNPVESDGFVVDLGTTNSSSLISIINLQGQLIYRQHTNLKRLKFNKNVVPDSGIYQIRVQQNDKIFTRKLVVH